MCQSVSRIVLNFNPRSHEGSDFTAGIKRQDPGNFNPRSHEGSDKFCHVFVAGFHKFQSTLPRRERRPVHPVGFRSNDFNPRSHEGSDVPPLQKIGGKNYFNPRSHEGSDDMPERCADCPLRFQSTLPRRERLRPLNESRQTFLFQSTLPRRERLCNTPAVFIHKQISIHAPTKGATRSEK